MAREIRITIDDDEVFERMKARKRDLDLSWEDVLHRGLRREPDQSKADHGGYGPDADDFGPDPGDFGPDFATGGPGRGDRDRSGRDRRRGSEREAGRGGPDSIGGFVDEIQRHVQEQVRESLQDSMDSVDGLGGGLEREMSELERAEDAVLRFDDVTDDLAHTVPLRVRLETSRDGMDVDVITVRQGKSVSGRNRFDRQTRQAVNEHLARGRPATLAFENGGGEAYTVAPVLSWSRSDDGTPTVSDVEIAEVLFDDGE